MSYVQLFLFFPVELVTSKNSNRNIFFPNKFINSINSGESKKTS